MMRAVCGVQVYDAAEGAEIARQPVQVNVDDGASSSCVRHKHKRLKRTPRWEQRNFSRIYKMI